ncbi:stage III sporulation protein AG [Ornithinibacillus sp. L9]|uniref:Stage III sporulation protein AG n=1 Tax=Ornithinibacillus caprae TaxID=2678566 RepID=A0A6N8FFX6_9BACI|nr:stage III sporulation protein AG [Ornithinibacillus caprae]MUK87164.1 stage III sporulation protein AG [Ornithinibacillus caprae]
MINKLQEFFQSRISSSKKTSYLILIGLVSLLLLLVGNIFSTSSQEDSTNQEMQMKLEQTAKDNDSDPEVNTATADVDELERSYKQDLEMMLEAISGVSEVEVMVNLDSTNVKVYEKNLIIGQQHTDENDQNGGTRQIEENTEEAQVVTIRQGDQEAPLLVQTKRPEVRGVLVVAKGVDHATVKQWVVEAVSRVLDVPTHRVSVMPKN